MQSKRQIRRLLAAAGTVPNRRLGQHFLIDLNLMRWLVELAQIGGEDVVLEVGCGTGSLTEAVAERAGRCIAVEVDEKLADVARQQLADFRNVTVLNTDILQSKSSISPLVVDAVRQARPGPAGRLLLVANLPYNVAAPVVSNLVWGPVNVDAMYVTVQKEIAERMTAGVGDVHYGILSIFLGVAGRARIERILKPAVFWPVPEVDSAMVSFVRDDRKLSEVDNAELFASLVKLFMQHRRKTVRACSRFVDRALGFVVDWKVVFERAGVDASVRPEQVSPGQYVAIANAVNEYSRKG